LFCRLLLREHTVRRDVGSRDSGNKIDQRALPARPRRWGPLLPRSAASPIANRSCASNVRGPAETVHALQAVV